MDMKTKMILFACLLVQIFIVAWSLDQLVRGNAKFLTYFNIIMNVIFGVMNIRAMMD